MAKRKREEATAREDAEPRKSQKQTAEALAPASRDEITIQIVTGSYERVLHGIAATISQSSLHTTTEKEGGVQFVDTFLFHAHASAIRCLALSPIADDSSLAQNVILASGGTDERINLYTLSATTTPTNDSFPSVPTLAGNKILENPKNRELGSLLHHSSSISALYFPTRSKLLASAEDNTISVTRTRDLSVVSTIKAPRPKAVGRPSGDTAPAGAAPAGINDFAVHPSMKLMLSVGKGEKCMRLWNLVTGKKAGVLNFGRDVLETVKEGKWSNGEGKKIVWDSAGQEFAVAFDRGVVVFGIDSVAKCYILPSPLTKVHQIKYVQTGDDDAEESSTRELLAVSTEDGRILFYSTDGGLLEQGERSNGKSSIAAAQLRCQLGGKEKGQSSRIKDFEFLQTKSALGHPRTLIIVTAGSDGMVKLWVLDPKELCSNEKSRGAEGKRKKKEKQASREGHGPVDVGRLLGTYETGNRITCLKAFMLAKAEGDEELYDEFSGLSGDEEADESESSGEESES
ncbi:WD domain, G-beta repeat containing protein [Coccidioides posadasii C735 delta SOWgp]|uniref:WD domain, G-beta repeat containing protein n=1 Tax=Coccidioides posadasii (strain C735) TaxID=222929 RepID=C5PDY3_COCP7|nr:WD domain, G-beta repeat containing protein [Coccidioides posadasii C735 delta SOWgp]EER25294.1 WD domain, G-beta repeat containing protein [Coccidioides posadasii C735 delta SOWgp]|eukprot:XP_003067439.1 WD domain, G-beta repeat containing protein [Coccidioides posadasii C735 delta SOWgp]